MNAERDHVSIASDVLLCDHCGARYDMGPALPMPANLAVAMMKSWGRDHRKCKGTTKAFRNPTGIGDWITSDDTGKSSKTIYGHMRFGYCDGSYPYDPSDFGRCYRLLNLAPEWRARIGEMAKHGAVWSKLAAAWDELTTLYEEELPTGNAPKLYARMKELGT